MQLGAEVITYIGSMPITNTTTSMVLLDLVLIVMAIVLRKQLSIIPGKLQSIFEFLYDFVLDLTTSVLDKKYIKPVFPWILSFFVVILISNWMGLLPGMETIYIKKEEAVVTEVTKDEHEAFAETEEHVEDEEHEEEHIALFKGVNADLNTTLALTLVSFLLVNISTLRFKGIGGWFKHYFHTKPLYLIAIFVFVGILEMLLDPIKFLSLGLRLFGNIFAGETLVAVMTTVPGLAVPFLLLEVLVGVIQALIFTGLSLTFLSLMVSAEEEEH
jgi:F-type H+-transporting ATPase subunit a